MLQFKNKFVRILIHGIVINTIFALIMFFVAKPDELTGAPPTMGFDRFITFFYYGLSLLTTTGSGEVLLISPRLKLIVCSYMLLIYSHLVNIMIR